MIEFFVPGKPQAQGSKTKGRWGNIREDNTELGPWRERVALAAYEAAGRSPADSQRAHRAGPGVRPLPPDVTPRSAPRRPPRSPTSTRWSGPSCDALTHVLWSDDAQVTIVLKRKRVAEIGESPGVHIWVSKPEIQGDQTEKSHGVVLPCQQGFSLVVQVVRCVLISPVGTA